MLSSQAEAPDQRKLRFTCPPTIKYVTVSPVSTCVYILLDALTISNQVNIVRRENGSCQSLFQTASLKIAYSVNARELPWSKSHFVL